MPADTCKGKGIQCISSNSAYSSSSSTVRLFGRVGLPLIEGWRVSSRVPEGIPVEIEMRGAAGTGLAAEQDVQHIRKSQKQVHDKYDNEYQDCDDEPEEKFQDNHNYVL